MKNLISIALLLLAVACAACKPAPGPEPKAATAKLTVVLNPACTNTIGHGTVTFTPAPQSLTGNCKLEVNNPVTCIAEFTQGQTVTIKETADPTTRPDGGEPLSYVGGFTGIAGCANPGLHVLPQEWSCQLTMNGDTQVSAIFCGRIF